MECVLESTTVHDEAFADERPFLMFYRGAGDHRFWSLALEPLFEKRHGWKPIYPDLPGHGRTAAPEWMTTEDQVLDVLLDLITWSPVKDWPWVDSVEAPTWRTASSVDAFQRSVAACSLAHPARKRRSVWFW